MFILPSYLTALTFFRYVIISCHYLIGNLLFNPLAFLYPSDLIYEIQRLGGYAYNTNVPTIADRLLIIGDHINDAIQLAWRWLLPASILGFISVIRYRSNPIYWIILSAFIVLFVVIANIVNVYYKVFYWTPWLIPMALLSAIGLGTLLEFLSARHLRVFGYMIIVATIVLESIFTLNLSSKMTRPDTRVLALEFVESNYPPNIRIVSGVPIVYSVPFIRNEASIHRARVVSASDLASWTWWLGLDEAERPKPAYDLYGPEMQSQIDTFDDLGNLIQNENIELVVESDYCWGGQNRPDSNSAEEYPALNNELRNNMELVAVFSPYADECEGGIIELRTGLALDNLSALNEQKNVGPVIRIYRPLFNE